MTKTLIFPNQTTPRIVKAEFFRYGTTALIIETAETFFREIDDAAKLSGIPRKTLLAQYARRIEDEYYSDAMPRRGRCRLCRGCE